MSTLFKMSQWIILASSQYHLLNEDAEGEKGLACASYTPRAQLFYIQPSSFFLLTFFCLKSNTMSNGNRRLLQTDNVFLYIPNIIGSIPLSSVKSMVHLNVFILGYTRIILASASLYYMPWHPKVCTILYCISCLLDAVDGNAARYFDQCKILQESHIWEHY